MKLAIFPASALIAFVAQFSSEIQVTAEQIVTITQLPGMGIVLSGILLAFATVLVPALGALRTR